MIAALLALSASQALAFDTHAFKESFGSAGSGDGQFELAGNSGLAVNETTHDIYVADTKNHRVDVFSEAGGFIRAFGADVGGTGVDVCTTGCVAGTAGVSPGAFEAPTFIAVDNSPGGEGDVYVADTGDNVVSKFKADGTLVSGWGSGGLLNGSAATNGPFGEIAGIAVDPLGTLDVFQSNENFLFQFSQGGTFSGELTLGTRGTAPVGLAVSADGHLFKTNGNGSLEKFDASGADVGQVTATGISAGAAIDTSDGSLYVDATSEINHYAFDGAGEVEEIDGSTCPVEPFGGPDEIACGPTDAFGASDLASGGAIAFDASSDTVFAADPGASRIKAFEAVVLPDVTTQPASSPGSHSVTLNGIVGAAGVPGATCQFQYATDAQFQSQGFAGAATSPCVPAGPFSGAGSEAVHADLEHLAAGTTFHFRLLATNQNGTNVGSPEVFSTLGPAVGSTSAITISATAATLQTEINPNGQATTYWFEYDTIPYLEGEEASHGSRTPIGSAGAGEAATSQGAQIQGLLPATTYYYRAVAVNMLGTAFGPGQSFTTQGAAASLLPDGRGWELVTPPNKHGAPLEPITEEGGLIEAAHEGDAFTEVATGPLGPESQGVRSLQINQWLSRRGPDGVWTTQDITTPREQISEALPGRGAEYAAFGEDLQQSLVQPIGATPLSPGATEPTPYRREADGEYVPLVTSANVPPNTEFGGKETAPGNHIFGGGVKVIGATPDLRHVILISPQVLAPGFSSSFLANGEENLYELSGGVLQLISVLPNEEPTAEAGLGTALGGMPGTFQILRGAVSDDGRRVVFEAGHHLYLRDTALGRTVQLDLPQAGPVGNGEAIFQGANSDGSKIFFTDNSRLTADASPGGSLYMCQIGQDAGVPTCALSDLSVAVDPSESADALGGTGLVSAIDSTGTHVYFAAGGVLTNTPNRTGVRAVPGTCTGESTCNLYEYDTATDQVDFIALLAARDGPSWGYKEDPARLTARSSPDGRYFAFMSTRSLTGYDNRDAHSGESATEVYLFDATSNTLRCVSCNPSGARPNGVLEPGQSVFPGLLVDHAHSWPEVSLAASIPGWTAWTNLIAPYQSRYLSNSGRLFFTAADALVPQDTNGVMDVYEYEPPGVGNCTTASATYGQASGGCVSLVSSGTSPEESAFLDADEEGENVFFLTQSRLTAKDTDTAFDVYDARVDGGETLAVNPPACTGDACQLPAVPPNDATPGSLTFNGAGDLLECPKGKVKQKGKCVKKKAKKKHHKKKSHKKHKKSKRAPSHKGGGGK